MVYHDEMGIDSIGDQLGFGVQLREFCMSR
jgi:hypothetical protein